MTITLVGPIREDQAIILVTAPEEMALDKIYQVDQELIILRSAPRSSRVSVGRGMFGSARATHAGGSALTPVSLVAQTGLPVSPPGPGGGSGGVTVDNGSDPPASVTTLVAPGATFDGGEATLGRWELTVGNDTDADLSVTATATNDGIANPQEANVSRSATATGDNDAYADTLVSAADGDAHANTTATVTGVQDANARTRVTTVGGNADITRRAEVTDAEGGDAAASTQAISEGGDANTRTAATTGSGGGTAQSYNEANVVDGDAESGSFAYASGDGDATAYNEATADGGGTATARSVATRGIHVAGVVAEADAVSARMGFFNVAPVAKPTGVAVSAVAIHAALVSLGLIEA